MALDRETVVRTALRLIDENGLEALTLRKLAADLGVQAPALYWHFRNKQELLDAVADRLGAEQRGLTGTMPKDGEPWWEWLGKTLLDARDGLLGHRDSALIVAGNRPTPDALPGVEAELSTLRSVGLPPEDALMFTLATGYFLIGGVLEQQLTASREGSDVDDEAFRQMQDAELYPTLAAAVAGIASEAATGGEDAAVAGLDDAVFRFGLELMIDGLRARLARIEEEPEA
ncbi:TetR/AcrR family transcriptional regulator C-terminal domain-containing protein [Cryptosporangium sp. NPDC048952]|uniref:TetR/AcrR family transcriptional regulator C-terminal domain-containing protein n=1 Tax=Cryptosporangium sp. NPDC048952 TaxID=3363961 RepID=UPI00372089E7